MRRVKILLAKFMRKSWLLLIIVLGNLLKDRVTGWGNRFLDAHSGPLVHGARVVLVWVSDTQLGVVGAFAALVTTGLLIYSVREAYHEKRESGAGKGRLRKARKASAGSNFFEERVLPSLVAVSILLAVMAFSAVVFSGERAYLNISNQSPPIVDENRYLEMEFTVTNPTGFPAREAAHIDQLWIEPDISEKSERDAFGVFMDNVRETMKTPPPKFLTIGPHQKLSFVVVGPTIYRAGEFGPGFPTDEELRTGKRVVFAFVLFRWLDGAGIHERHFCQAMFNDKNGLTHRIVCRDFND